MSSNWPLLYLFIFRRTTRFSNFAWAFRVTYVYRKGQHPDETQQWKS